MTTVCIQFKVGMLYNYLTSVHFARTTSMQILFWRGTLVKRLGAKDGQGKSSQCADFVARLRPVLIRRSKRSRFLGRGKQARSNKASWEQTRVYFLSIASCSKSTAENPSNIANKCESIPHSSRKVA